MAGMEELWQPGQEEIENSNLACFMRQFGFNSYADLHAWSADDRMAFWETFIKHMKIPFHQPADLVADFSRGVEDPVWLPGAKFNIAEACFMAPDEQVALIYQGEAGAMKCMTFGGLKAYASQLANGLVAAGFKPGDALAIDMPMTLEAVAAYLGIVMAGMAVVSIADSFAAEEIATRLKIADAKGIFTQDVILRGGKTLPLYARVCDAGAPRAIVIPAGESMSLPLREGDMAWDDFLSDNDSFIPVSCTAETPCNILFSSGTTGEPKAIVWDHASPLKSVMDAYFHHDVRVDDVVAWPTNLGWMMGPWLIFSSLVNRSAMALYYGAPTGEGFGRFVEEAQVTMLGLVPSLVKAWRGSACLEDCDWSSIRNFSSTGECSSPDEMAWLMEQAGNRPVIEYCGGTEIGGGYIVISTMLDPSIPSTFTTPTLGLDFVVLDEKGDETDEGELFIIPPSIGLSRYLLNKDHHQIYYADTPRGPNKEVLRRHGDEFVHLANGYWRGLGRADDTMNLGGIKVSSVELERCVNRLDEVKESAAIAVTPAAGGASFLVLFVVCEGEPEKAALQKEVQQAIREHLNPLFKVADVVIVDSLPRTASNKVMRRVLRSEYQA